MSWHVLSKVPRAPRRPPPPLPAETETIETLDEARGAAGRWAADQLGCVAGGRAVGPDCDEALPRAPRVDVPVVLSTIFPLVIPRPGRSRELAGLAASCSFSLLVGWRGRHLSHNEGGHGPLPARIALDPRNDLQVDIPGTLDCPPPLSETVLAPGGGPRGFSLVSRRVASAHVGRSFVLLPVRCRRRRPAALPLSLRSVGRSANS